MLPTPILNHKNVLLTAVTSILCLNQAQHSYFFPCLKMFSWVMAPCVIFEDGHLLAVNKPAGWNTHAPSPCAGEGIYDWLRHREPRWATLSILHRLDKETSGILVFGKTPVANRSLTEQFTNRSVHKKYLLLTDRAVPGKELTVKSTILRVGEKYASRPGGELAETKFALAQSETKNEKSKALWAMPLTGRTHQIRVHAAEQGFPILGDVLYGGTAAARVFLHAAEIEFAHPVTGQRMVLKAPLDLDEDTRLALRSAVIDPQQTNAFRVIHGASDGWPGWYVEKLGDYLLSQSEQPLAGRQNDELNRLTEQFKSFGAYHKTLSRQVRRSTPAESSPQLVLGHAALERFEILENGVLYELSFTEGYSVGLFLDQRDNRRRLLTSHIAQDFQLQSRFTHHASQLELLNVFAYTCGFSVCAAKSGFRTTSLDLSKKYLEWGRRNFTINSLDPAAHDFIYGDAFDWLRRLGKKGRAFDVIVLDPPTFSQSREHGAFRADKDYGKLVAAALPVLKSGGVLLASTNAAEWSPEDFLAAIEAATRSAGRKILQKHYIPQPPDFPISRNEPAYLKTVWVKVA